MRRLTLAWLFLLAIELFCPVFCDEPTFAAELDSPQTEIKDEDLNFISPARFAHINPYGRYYFNIEENLNRKGLKPLRK